MKLLKEKPRFLFFLLALATLAFVGSVSYANAQAEAEIDGQNIMSCAGFNDVPASNQFCAAITFIKNLSITAGCGGGNFCPTDSVRREQMAQFMRNMLRANATNETYIMDIQSTVQGIRAQTQSRALSGQSLGGSSASDGVWGASNRPSMTWAGLYGTGSAGASGVWGSSSGGGPGVRASSSSTGQYASRTTSSAYRGAYFQGHTSWYDAYFDGDVGIFVNGNCTGCTMAYIVQNNGFEAIEAGDLVAITGIAAPLVEGQAPVITVSKANADNQHALAGVVSARYVVEFKTEPIMEVEHVEHEAIDGLTGETITFMEKEEIVVGERTVESGYMADGPIMPGDYLIMIYEGMAQVRVSSDARDIQVGAELVGSLDGSATTTESATQLSAGPHKVVGTALEAQADSQGLIWMLVKIR